MNLVLVLNQIRRDGDTYIHLYRMGSACELKTNLMVVKEEEEGQRTELQQSTSTGFVQPKPVGELVTTSSQFVVNQGIPQLFTPIQIRGLTLSNRILFSPMCMYSCEPQDGTFQDFHLAHYASFALRGPGLVITESTAVSPEGRITPRDVGIWNDVQKESLSRVTNLVHASGSKLCIQLAHAGRKASQYPPYYHLEEGAGLARTSCPIQEGGFPDRVVAPTATPWKPSFPIPHEMTADEVKEMVKAWGEAARRAVEAGVDAIEIHAGHGYLIHQFLSGNTNKRTDEYGGNLQNRLRFLLEIITAIRATIPAGIPLFCRVSGTDYATPDQQPLSRDPDGWDIYQVIELCRAAVPLGLDLIDISSGGNIAARYGVYGDEYGFQLPFTETVKAAGIERLLVGAVGLLGNAKKSEEVLQQGKADLILCGRQFLDNPNLIYRMAEQLDVNVRRAAQYSWMFPFRNDV